MQKTKKAYIVAVDMGYGHQRAVFPLLDIATTPKHWNQDVATIISANKYPGIPKKDRNTWEETRKMYESISRMYGFPFFGRHLFHAMDYFQRIESFYPKRDLSKPNLQLKYLYKKIKKGFGKHLIEELNTDPLPLLTSFFVPAFCAEEHGYKGPIYCLCTDTDISRAWAPLNPQKSRIIYLAPNNRVKERLKLYGVSEDKIFITGFPLPKETSGDEKELHTVRKSLARRIAHLDPNKLYQKKYGKIISLYLEDEKIPKETRPVSITFAVGGAGAQWMIGVNILKSLAPQIKEGSVSLNLVAGSSQVVKERYENALNTCKMDYYLGKGVDILFDSDKYEYFKKFNELLIETDILWTKPSELSFYAGLGIPIIMAPALGSQEEFNRSWLHAVGAGFEQNNPKYTGEWLMDWIYSGWLAEAAMNGYVDAPKRGTYHVEDLILHDKKTEIEDIHFL